jgi:hypothetical protein
VSLPPLSDFNYTIYFIESRYSSNKHATYYYLIIQMEPLLYSSQCETEVQQDTDLPAYVPKSQLSTTQNINLIKHRERPRPSIIDHQTRSSPSLSRTITATPRSTPSQTMNPHRKIQRRHTGRIVSQIRSPENTAAYYYKPSNVFEEMNLKRQRELSHVARIEETSSGMIAETPCTRCVQAQVRCMVYTAEAHLRFNNGLAKAGDACARCRYGNKRCDAISGSRTKSTPTQLEQLLSTIEAVLETNDWIEVAAQRGILDRIGLLLRQLNHKLCSI